MLMPHHPTHPHAPDTRIVHRHRAVQSNLSIKIDRSINQFPLAFPSLFPLHQYIPPLIHHRTPTTPSIRPPTQPNPQTKMSPAPPAKPSLPTTTTTTPTLPPPFLFDLLPALYELLSRIDPPDDHHPFDPKDLPTAILPLKAQMRRALREVAALPDIDRGVVEQEAEIVELELLRRRQEEALKGLGEVCTGVLERGQLGGG